MSRAATLLGHDFDSRTLSPDDLPSSSLDDDAATLAPNRSDAATISDAPRALGKRSSGVQLRSAPEHAGWFSLERDLHDFVRSLRLPDVSGLAVEQIVRRAPAPLRIPIANIAADLARLHHGGQGDAELQLPVAAAPSEVCALVAALGEVVPHGAARVRAIHLDAPTLASLSLRHLRLGFRSLEVIWAPADEDLRAAMEAPELQVALWKRDPRVPVTRGAIPRDEVTFFERWTVAFANAAPVQSMVAGTAPIDVALLHREEHALLVLLAHPELPAQHPATRQRAYDQLDRVRALRRYHSELAPRFAQRHAALIAQGFRALGLVVPGFDRIGRPEALREIARFDIAYVAQRRQSPAARQLQGLLHFHLRDLALE